MWQRIRRELERVGRRALARLVRSAIDSVVREVQEELVRMGLSEKRAQWVAQILREALIRCLD